MSSLAEAARAAQVGGHDPPPPEPGFVAFLRKIDLALAKVEEVALTLCLFALLLVGVFSALKRNFFPPSVFWADEVIRYMVFFIGLLGAALAAQSDRLFNIDMFARTLGPRPKLVVRILSAAFTIGICWLFALSSMTLRDVLSGEDYEVISPQRGVLPLPGAMIAISIHLALHIVIDAYYLSIGKLPPELTVPKVGH